MAEESAVVIAKTYGKSKNVKKAINDEGREESQKIGEDPFELMYGDGDVLAPPFNMHEIARLIKMSNTLPQCIEAMEQNCEGFGYNLSVVVREEEISESLKEAIKKEKDEIDNFFQYVSYEMSFTKLRKKMRKDLEGFGNGYFEVLRNMSGTVDGFEYVKAITVRLGKLSSPIQIEIHRKNVEGHDYRTVEYKKRFRMFVQIVSSDKVYFKEYGDPRGINAHTGKVITEDDKIDAESRGETIHQATEIIHFKIEDPETSYGIPRWIGNMISVSGSRSAEEVNLDYFDSKTIPPLVITVSGGTLGKDTHGRITQFVEEDIKGKENFHKILVLEAEGQTSPHSMEKSTVRIGFKELTQMKEGMFQEYDKKNREKVRSSFRLPPIYVGLVADFNRATAITSREVAEEQVFTPEKADFDFMINHKIFPDLEIKYHRNGS